VSTHFPTIPCIDSSVIDFCVLLLLTHAINTHFIRDRIKYSYIVSVTFSLLRDSIVIQLLSSSISTRPSQVSAMPRSKNDLLFDKCRKPALLSATKSNFYKQQSQEAFKRGDIIFDFHNSKKSNKEIDLHGLLVSEAIDFLSKRVEAAKNSNENQLIVIVGRGLHSQGGPKIKPAVVKFANKHKIQFHLDSPNAGCITFLFNHAIPHTKRRKKQSKRRARNNRHDTVIQITDTIQDENENGESGIKRCLLSVIFLVVPALLLLGVLNYL
jgi:DNA-nicking Smr family endonuclease